MAGVANPSLPTFSLNAATVVSREAEYPNPDVDFAGGVNRGGSCAPGIGINSGDIDPKVEDWTTLDQGLPVESGESQTPLVRNPQSSQHIGGSGLMDADAVKDPVSIIVDPHGGEPTVAAASFVVADQQATDGNIMHIASATRNRTGSVVEIGDRAWGDMPA